MLKDVTCGRLVDIMAFSAKRARAARANSDNNEQAVGKAAPAAPGGTLGMWQDTPPSIHPQ